MGKYLIEINNKLVISDGVYADSSIEAIIDINVDNATNMQIVLEDIQKYVTNNGKGSTSSASIKIIENLYGTEILTVYHAYDFQDIGENQNSTYPTRSNGYKDFGYNREKRYGGKGKPEYRGSSFKTGLVTLEYPDGTIEKIPLEECER